MRTDMQHNQDRRGKLLMQTGSNGAKCGDSAGGCSDHDERGRVQLDLIIL